MNKNIIYIALAFIGGAAAGGFTCWKVAEKKYSDIAQEEINSVKEKFTVPKKEIKKKIETEKNPDVKIQSNKALTKPSLVEYSKRLKENLYTNYSNSEEEKKKSGKSKFDKGIDEPYVITPDEFADGIDEKDDYERVELTFYADGILAYTDSDKIINADEIIGDALEHIGDYEDDAVHVCNPRLKTLYEVLEDECSYEKATNKSPHRDGDEED